MLNPLLSAEDLPMVLLFQCRALKIQSWVFFLFLFTEWWWCSLFSSVYVVQSLSHVRLCDPIDLIMPGFSVLHYLLEFAQTYVRWIDDAIQPSRAVTEASRHLPCDIHRLINKHIHRKTSGWWEKIIIANIKQRINPPGGQPSWDWEALL